MAGNHTVSNHTRSMYYSIYVHGRFVSIPAAERTVGRRGLDRVRKHYPVPAMTDAYLDAIGAVR